MHPKVLQHLMQGNKVTKQGLDIAHSAIDDQPPYRSWWPKTAREFMDEMEPRHQTLLFLTLYDVKSQEALVQMLESSTAAWPTTTPTDPQDKLVSLLKTCYDMTTMDFAHLASKTNDLATCLIAHKTRSYKWTSQTLDAVSDMPKLEKILKKIVEGCSPGERWFIEQASKCVRRVPLAEIIAYVMYSVAKIEAVFPFPTPSLIICASLRTIIISHYPKIIIAKSPRSTICRRPPTSKCSASEPEQFSLVRILLMKM